jgi:FkbM family methyltransferase
MKFLKSLLIRTAQLLLARHRLRIIHVLPAASTYEVDTVIDVGVADGTQDLYDKYPNAKYVFIEPNPIYQKYISEFLIPKYDAMLIPMAAGSKTERLMLSNNGLSSGLLPRQGFRGREEFAVDVGRLDDMLDDTNVLSNANSILLKIDTEGFEYNVLQGAQRFLNSDKLKFIQIEVRINFVDTNYNPTDIFVFLNNYGFQFDEILKISQRKDGISYIDIAFKRAK